jgi:hypothetical protein
MKMDTLNDNIVESVVLALLAHTGFLDALAEKVMESQGGNVRDTLRTAALALDPSLEPARAPVTCANCGGIGHNTTTCITRAQAIVDAAAADVPDDAL